MIQHLSKSRKVFITGGSSGLGLELVKIFINMGDTVFATGRKPVQIYGSEELFNYFQVDFSKMEMVKNTMKTIMNLVDGFDIIINNAGVLSPPVYTASMDGYEYTYQVNFLSHLLINEIILRKTKNNRPIKLATVTSPVYRLAATCFTTQTGLKDYSPVKAYMSSKLFLTLMSEFLPARNRELDLQSFSFDPGTFRSGIYRMQKKWFHGMYHIASPFMRSPEKVAKILAEILIKEDVKNGMICDLRKRIRPIPSIDKRVKAAFEAESYDRIDTLLRSI